MKAGARDVDGGQGGERDGFDADREQDAIGFGQGDQGLVFDAEPQAGRVRASGEAGELAPGILIQFGTGAQAPVGAAPGFVGGEAGEKAVDGTAEIRVQARNDRVGLIQRESVFGGETPR